MTRSAPQQLAFSSGEISPLLHRRSDFQRFQTGLAACRGFLPLRQGGFTRAPGTIFRGFTRGNLPARLIPFEFSVSDTLTLELTAGKMRVWRYGSLVMSGGVPYELDIPYDDAAIARLHWTAADGSDRILMADGSQPLQRLSRFALDNWTIEPAPVTNGPFRVQNLDKALTVQASATTGTITLTASAALFQPGHVGGLIRLKPTDNSSIPLWTGNTTAAVGQKMRNDGKTYQLAAGTGTGVNPPIHDEGTEQVQLSPVIKWTFLDDGQGIARITAVSSPTVATATVIQALPQGVVDDPTYRFEEGAWSDLYGYPAVIEIDDERLIAGNSPSEPRTLWFSGIGDALDFFPGTDADSAFTFAIPGGGQIAWIARGRGGIHVGLDGAQYTATSTDAGTGLSRETTRFEFDFDWGSKPGVRPISPDGAPIWVSKDGTRLMQKIYNLDQDANRPIEMSLTADHLGADGFEELAWQSMPQRIAWLRRGNGELAAMVHDPAEDVLGWAPLPLAGGAVESMAVTTDLSGANDTLTLAVRRVVDGVTLRMVEDQASTFGLLNGAQPIAEAVHFFAASVFVPGAATDTFAVPHLAGEDVHVWTDTGEFGPITVAPDGSVTLPVQVGRAVIGLFDQTHRARTLPLQANAPDGSTAGRRRRLSPYAGIGLHRSAAGTVAVVEMDFAQPERILPARDLIPRGVAADLTVAFSGMSRSPVTSGHADEVALEFRPVSGAPLTITAVAPAISEAGL